MKSIYAFAMFYCILSSILLIGCDNNANIKRVSVKYYLGVFETIASISYEELQNAKAEVDTFKALGIIIDEESQTVKTEIDSIKFGDYDIRGIKDTTITDTQVLLRIKEALSRLKVSSTKDTFENVRIICTIEYQSGKKDFLNIDGVYANGLRFNGYGCKNDLELIYLIKKNSGYYSRMQEQMLRRFNELADTCFNDTLTNEWGQKYWRGKYPPLI